MLTLDAKGRLTVPAKWREELVQKAAGQLVVCKDPAGCLGLYPPAVFEQLAEALMKLDDEHADEWRRLYLGSHAELEIDSGSRILIPPELRRWAGFKESGSVIFMGVGMHFELWDPERSVMLESQVIAKGKPASLRQAVKPQ